MKIMSVSKYVDKIWQNMARKQLENELNFLTTDDNERIKLPIDDSIDYLKIFNDTHKTPEEELQEENELLKDKINKAIEKLEEEIEQSDGCIYVELPEELYIKKLQKYLDILRGENNGNH